MSWNLETQKKNLESSNLEILNHEILNLEHKRQFCIMYILYHKRLLISRDTNQIWNTFLLKSYYTHAPTHRQDTNTPIHTPYTLHSFFKVNGYSFGLIFLIYWSDFLWYRITGDKCIGFLLHYNYIMDL